MNVLAEISLPAWQLDEGTQRPVVLQTAVEEQKELCGSAILFLSVNSDTIHRENPTSLVEVYP